MMPQTTKTAAAAAEVTARALLLLASVNTVRSLRMLTRSQTYEVEASDNVELHCQFYADSFNLFDYPVVWHKRQRHWPHEENFVHQQHPQQQQQQQQYDWLANNSIDDGTVEDCQVNMMGNLLEPFASFSRYQATFVSRPPKYHFGLSLTDVLVEDSANYTCQIDGPLNTVIGHVTHQVVVNGPVEEISIHGEILDNNNSVTTTDDIAIQSTNRLSFTENQPAPLRCKVVGGRSSVDPRIYLADNDVTSGFTVSRTRSTVGARCMRRPRYVTVGWSEGFVVSAEHDGTVVDCRVVAPQLTVPVASDSATLTVRYSPVVHCDEPSAALGQTNAAITCDVKARPEVTALYWISDIEAGTTITAGDSGSDLWTSNMVGGEALLVSKLYVRRVKAEHFRTFTIIAENLLGTTSHDVTLVRRYQAAADGKVSNLLASSSHVRDGGGDAQRMSHEQLRHASDNDYTLNRATTQIPTHIIGLFDVALLLHTMLLSGRV